MSGLLAHLGSRRQKTEIIRLRGLVDARGKCKCSLKVRLFEERLLLGASVEWTVRIVTVGHDKERAARRVRLFNERPAKAVILRRVPAVTNLADVEALLPTVTRPRLEVFGLAETGVEVAVLVQDFRQQRNTVRHRLEPAETGIVRVAPGHKRLARGLADREGDVGALEAHPFASEPIDVRRQILRPAEASRRVVIHVIHRNQQDVRPLRCHSTGRQAKNQRNTHCTCLSHIFFLLLTVN